MSKILSNKSLETRLENEICEPIRLSEKTKTKALFGNPVRIAWVVSAILFLFLFGNVHLPLFQAGKSSSEMDAFAGLSEQDRFNSNFWISHLVNDLLPFWEASNRDQNKMSPFPSFLFDSGEKVSPKNYSEYAILANSKNGNWILKDIGKDFSRMHARQTFANGVAFHLTGDPKYFHRMRTGVQYSINSGFDTFGALPVLNPTNTEENKINARNSQDQAYSLIGLAFYYYLTRDMDVLSVILEQYEYIFDTYANLNEAGGLDDFLYFPSDGKTTELVAILDQLNAYMVLIYPILPNEHQPKWANRMRALCELMLEKFYVEAIGYDARTIVVNSFWGHLSEKKFGGKHFDFGHSVKAWWMIYLTGQLLEDEILIQKGLSGARHILENGFVTGAELAKYASRKHGYGIPALDSQSTWGEKYFPSKQGDISFGQHWWIHCEMDQAAAMIFQDQDMLQKLRATSRFFVDRYVDHQAGGVWHSIDPFTMKPLFMKVHSWKNAYHSFEHALIMAIHSQIESEGMITLHYAFKNFSPMETPVQPYYFKDVGVVYDVKYGSMKGLDSESVAITFDFRKESLQE